MQHSFLVLHTAILALSQKCLGAIHSAPFILGMNMAHAWARTSVAFWMDLHAASLPGSLSQTGLYEF